MISNDPSTVPDPSIVCVECGATAGLLREYSPDDPPLPGEAVVYICPDCDSRWDVVYEPE